MVLLVTIVSVEVFAHFYVQVDPLPVVTAEDALNTPFLLNNGTTVYSANGAKWLLVLSCYRDNNAPSGSTKVYVFKLQDNSTFPAQSVNIKPLSITFNTVRSDINTYGSNSYREGFYLNKCTIAAQDYYLSGIGKYDADISFTFRIYQQTLFGYIPGQEATVHFNATFIYP